jgi:branched-subunit amino acid transport protein AzlD
MMLTKGVAIALAAVGLALWLGYGYFFLLDSTHFLAENASPVINQVILIVYGYMVLLVGVFLGSVYRQLKALTANETVNIASVVRSALASKDFWLGMFASPVVYVVLLQAINLERFTIAAFIGVTLVGLQNGFVCNVVADALIAGRQRSGRG